MPGKRPTFIHACGFAALALSMQFSAPLSAKVIDQGEGSFVTRDSVTVTATPYETWQALIAPGKWWNDSHTWSGDAKNMYISPQAGGCFCELLPIRPGAPEGVMRGSAMHMEVLFVDPPTALRMRGGLGPLQSEPAEGVLTITLKPVAAGTQIVFEYAVGGYMRYKTAEIAVAVDRVMSEQMNGLAQLLGPAAHGAGSLELVTPTDEGVSPGAAKKPAKPDKKSPSVDDAFKDLNAPPGR